MRTNLSSTFVAGARTPSRSASATTAPLVDSKVSTYVVLISLEQCSIMSIVHKIETKLPSQVGS